MATQANDDAVIGKLLRTYEENKNHIEYLRKRIDNKAQYLAELSQLLEAKPEAILASGDSHFVLGTGRELGVSCDMLQELGQEIIKLQNALETQKVQKANAKKMGMGLPDS